MDPLICPVCKSRHIDSPLYLKEHSLYCENKHCFDISRTGSVTFTTPSGDDKNMVKARTEFLNTGAYEPFAERLGSKITNIGNDIVAVDAGCGEGYYSNRFARFSNLYGFDLSKSAIAHASKTAKSMNNNAFFAVCGIFDLPIASSSVDAVFSIFAPISDEFMRILKPNGLLIIGAAGKHHLWELKSAVYDTVYENEGRHDLPSCMELVSSENLTYRFMCEGEHIKQLFSMTPYYYKTSKSGIERLEQLKQLEITADFDIFVYRKKI